MEKRGSPPGRGRRLQSLGCGLCSFLGGQAVISPFDAWAVKRALAGHDLTDMLPGLSRMLRPVVEHLGTLPSAEANPGGTPPEGETGRRAAHLGDLAANTACRRFVWPGWIVRGEFNLLSAD